MNPVVSVAVLLAGTVLMACAQETPTDVGGTLLPGGVRTYEVILEPSRFAVGDTAFGGYTDVQAGGLLLLAEAFDGVVDANIVGRLTMPVSINVRDATGNTVTDSMPVFFGGRFVIGLDTLASAGPASANLRLSRLAEQYDPGTATWTLRADTSDVEVPWTTPGGAPGDVVNTWTWQPGSDSLVIPIDSAAIAAWTDTLATVKGFVLELETPNTRLRPTRIALQVDARSSIDTDTTVTVAATSTAVLSLITPLVSGTAQHIRVGGTPGWRGMLRMRERLDTLRIPCLDGGAGCTVALGDASVTAASLIFEPSASPAGYALESSLLIGVRELIVRAGIPLERSPLGSVVGSTSRPLLPGALQPGPGRTVELPVTEYIRRFTDGDDDYPTAWLAMAGSPEGGTFGFATFAELPRLRLIVSVGTELQLR